MKYRKKPVEIEAIQWNGENIQEVYEFARDALTGEILAFPDENLHEMAIHTLEGDMVAKPGDFIIKGIKGEFYPCKPDIFEQTYEVTE